MVKVKREKFYANFSIKEKRELREKLEHICELKKRQIELFEKNFIKPLKEQIQLTEKVKKNEISIERYLKLNMKWSEWLLTVLNGLKEGFAHGKK